MSLFDSETNNMRQICDAPFVSHEMYDMELISALLEFDKHPAVTGIFP